MARASTAFTVARAELLAIKAETETAVDAIMTAAETIHEAGDASGQAMAVIGACAFQDITGQRVSKVLQILDELEGKLAAVAAGRIPGDEETEAQRRRREQILNGPALDGPEVDQAAIDALFD